MGIFFHGVWTYGVEVIRRKFSPLKGFEFPTTWNQTETKVKKFIHLFYIFYIFY